MLDLQLKKVRCQVDILQQLLCAMMNNVRQFEEGPVLDMIHLVFLALDQWAAVEEEVCKNNEAVIAQDWQRTANAAVKTACDSISTTHSLYLREYEKRKLPKHLKVNIFLFFCYTFCKEVKGEWGILKLFVHLSACLAFLHMVPSELLTFCNSAWYDGASS